MTRVFTIPMEATIKCEAAENSQEGIQDFEHLLQPSARVENRERAEPHFLDGVLDSLNLRGIFHSHADRRNIPADHSRPARPPAGRWVA